MLFTSAVFLLIFLPLLVAAYWLAPQRFRMILLLVASYAFYLSWRPEYGLLLIASTLVNFSLARSIPGSTRPRALLVAGVVWNLSVLGFFKYAGLFSEGAADLLALVGLGEGEFDGLQILLPLAISFFTFEMISVQVDVYRGDIRIEGLLRFATYKAFFPKLISGPITRYGELAPRLGREAPLTFAMFQSGVALFTLGLAKKLVLADNLSSPADQAFADPASMSALAVAWGVGAFGLQIYFDFSGYTDMARGISRTLGLELPRNFRFPYAAASPSDFWRRWHMTLSRWLRDYLYIPLGGSRAGQLATYRNLMITMTLGGLWHGAGWSFAIWGAMHGTMLSIDHSLRGRFDNPGRALRLLGATATMAGIFFAWIFFRADSLAEAVAVIAAIADPIPFEVLAVAVGAALALVQGYRLAEWAAQRADAELVGRPYARAVALTSVTLACWVGAMALARSSLTPFVYFQF